MKQTTPHSLARGDLETPVRFYQHHHQQRQQQRQERQRQAAEKNTTRGEKAGQEGEGGRERGREGRGGVTRSWLPPPTPAPIFALHLAQHLHQNLANNKTVGAGRWRARGVGRRRRAAGDGRLPPSRSSPSAPHAGRVAERQRLPHARASISQLLSLGISGDRPPRRPCAVGPTARPDFGSAVGQ